MIFHALLQAHSLSFIQPKILVKNLLLTFVERMKQDFISFPVLYSSIGPKLIESGPGTL